MVNVLVCQVKGREVGAPCNVLATTYKDPEERTRLDWITPWCINL